MLAHPSQNQAEASANVSDAGSSSLSELDDIPEDNQDYGQQSEGEGIGDNDTEASTERIDPSPQKMRDFHTRQPSGLDLLGDAAAVEQLQEADAEAEQESEDIQRRDMDAMPAPRQFIETAASEVAEAGVADSPRKRKRSSSLSELEDDMEDTVPPARKRSASDRADPALNAIGRQMSAEPESAFANDGPPRPEEHAVASSEDEDDQPSPQVEVPEQPEIVTTAPNDAHQSSDEQLSEATPPPPEPEQEEQEDKPADTEDQEPTAKTEDEALRKAAALEDLKPIETLFAILRDKLFDERLATLSAEITSLQAPAHLITHPDFLARRACIDDRRDQKIKRAETELHYKSSTLETHALADRAIAHGQYVQEVREIREAHLERMNAHFSALQRERRQFKNRDPHYAYMFNSKRGQQIKAQQSYNKEVSLLSGMARYEGFPAAPALEMAREGERDDDLRRIRSLRQQNTVDRSHLQNFAGVVANMTPSSYHHFNPHSTPQINGVSSTPLANTTGTVANPVTNGIPVSNNPLNPGSRVNGTLSAHTVGVSPRPQQPLSYAARIAHEEMSGEATFLERNPWARQIPMAALGRVPNSWNDAPDPETPSRPQQPYHHHHQLPPLDGDNRHDEKPTVIDVSVGRSPPAPKPLPSISAATSPPFPRHGRANMNLNNGHSAELHPPRLKQSQSPDALRKDVSHTAPMNDEEMDAFAQERAGAPAGAGNGASSGNGTGSGAGAGGTPGFAPIDSTRARETVGVGS